MVKFGLIGENDHLFFYKWGLTYRRRQGRDWRHFTARMRTGRYAQTRTIHAIFSVETWKTGDGTTTRIPRTKRYINLKVLL